MSTLDELAADDVDHEEVEAFVCVGADGTTTFCRRRVGDIHMDWSGKLPPEFFPSWTEQKFASLNFQVDQLKAPAEVLLTWAGPELPAGLARSMPKFDFDATWSEHLW